MRIKSDRRKNPLRYGFYLILAGFIIFLLSGWLSGPIQVTAFAQVKRPAPEVITYLSDMDHISTWIGKIDDYNIIQGKLNAEGSKYRLIFSDGQNATITLRKLSGSSGSFIFDLETDIIINEISVTIEELDEQTTDVSISSDIEGKDILTRAILVFLKSIYHTETETRINQLKNDLETSS